MAPLIGSLCLTLYSLAFDGVGHGAFGLGGFFLLSAWFSLLFVVPCALTFGLVAGRLMQLWKLRSLLALLFIACFALLAQTIALLVFRFPDWRSVDDLIALSLIAVLYSQSAAIVVWWRLNPPRADCSQSQ